MYENIAPIDRAEAIRILQRDLTPKQLRNLVNNGIERMVARTEYFGPKTVHKISLPDDQLASFLLDLRGTEILQDRKLRLLLLEKCQDDLLLLLASWNGTIPKSNRQEMIKQITDRRWHPGKSWPRYLASKLGFHSTFAGHAGLQETPAEEIVEARYRLPRLHDYQQELVEQIEQLRMAPPGSNHAILSLPTGAGKTRTAVQALVTAWNSTGQTKPFILWIAQGDELCEQAAGSFREVFQEFGLEGTRSKLHLYRYWGSRNTLPDPFGEGIIIATIKKLSELASSDAGYETLMQIADDTFAIVIDEAHHAIADSYTEVLDACGVLRMSRNASIPLIGLTATPYRGFSSKENNRLAELFHRRQLTSSLLGDNPIERLRERGILCAAEHQILPTSCSFDMDQKEIDYYQHWNRLPDSLMKTVSQDHERNALLLDRLLKLPTKWPVLFFGCTVEHASAFTALLRRQGRSAALVTGETHPATRRYLIEAFRQGNLQFLCNYGVLTTGFDAPKIRSIVISRPTASVVLYEQMIGRGMRGPNNGGTDECLVIDLKDNINRFEGQMAYTRFTEYWR